MIVVILQPSYIPWRGYFDQIRRADLFIFYDDVQYDKHGWRNRNQIKTAQGKQWLTIPVHSAGVTQGRRIREVAIDWSRPWPQQHLRALTFSYNKAPYFKRYLPLLESFYARHDACIADFTIDSTIALARELGAERTRFLRSSELEGITGDKTDRYKFRTSPLRNLALQPAFFHNGAYTTLEEAVAHHLSLESVTAVDRGLRHGDTGLIEQRAIDERAAYGELGREYVQAGLVIGFAERAEERGRPVGFPRGGIGQVRAQIEEIALIAGKVRDTREIGRRAGFNLRLQDLVKVGIRDGVHLDLDIGIGALELADEAVERRQGGDGERTDRYHPQERPSRGQTAASQTGIENRPDAVLEIRAAGNSQTGAQSGRRQRAR